LKFETTDAVDDIKIKTSSNSEIYIQAKHSITLGQTANSIFSDWDVAQGMRQWAAEAGKDKGLAYAESFRVMKVFGE